MTRTLLLQRVAGTRRAAIAVAAGAACVAVLGTSVAVAATPVSGSVSGPVTSVKGTTFTLKTSLSPTGSSKISVGKTTVITEQATGTRADLKKGICLVANGQRNSKGVVAAVRVTITQPVKGQCNAGFGRGGTGRPSGGTPPAGGSGSQRPPGGFGGAGNFGFAFGTVTAVEGASLTVKGQQGSTSVTVSSKSTISKTLRVGSSAIAVKSCAFVRGTSTDKGVTVAAQDVSLSKPTSAGCTFGFRRPGQ